MNDRDRLSELLSAFANALTDEDLLLSTLLGKISAAIAAARISKGYSQKEFAQMMGVSQGLVSRWESGECNFTMQTLVKIALALNIKMDSPYLGTHSQWTSTHENVIDLQKWKYSRGSEPNRLWFCSANQSSSQSELLEM